MDETGVRWLIQEDDDGPRDRHDFFAAVKAFFGLTDSVEDLVRTYRADYPSCYRRDEASIAVVTQLSRLGLKIAVVTKRRAQPSAQSTAHRRGGRGETPYASRLWSGLVSPPGQSLWRRPVNAAYLSRVGWSVTAPRRISAAPGRLGSPRYGSAEAAPGHWPTLFQISSSQRSLRRPRSSLSQYGVGLRPDQTPLAPNAHSPVLWATNPTVGLPLCSEGGLKVRYAKPSLPRQSALTVKQETPRPVRSMGLSRAPRGSGSSNLSHPTRSRATPTVSTADNGGSADQVAAGWPADGLRKQRDLVTLALESPARPLPRSRPTQCT